MTQRQFDALCRNKMTAFFQRSWRELDPTPYEHNWHIDCISEYLEAVETGEIKRLIINVPPRTGKTLLVNVAFPAWVMGRNPGARILGVSYAHRLAEQIAYKQRLLMETAWFRDLMPKCVLDKDQLSKTNFATTANGGRFSTSVGGTLTGAGGDYIIVDDPQNPEEALSDVKRIGSNEWVDQALFTRLNNPNEGRIVVIMQRLHSEDTTGHLLKKGQWEHLKLPAYTEKKISVQVRGKEFEYEGYLHPERLGKETLDNLHDSMGTYAYTGQYIQEPVPLGGGEFKSDYLNYYASKAFDAKRCNIYIIGDPASSKKKTSDYTAMAVWALAPDQNYYLIDGVKERLNPTERVDRLFELHRKWNELTGKPPKVGWEKYGMMSDIHYIQKKQNEENYRFHVEELGGGTQKEERIRRLIPPMERGQVWLPNDMFYKDHKGLPKNFISDMVETEMLLFPFAPHDDFLDAMSRIFDMNPIFPKMNSFQTTTGYYGNYNSDISVLDL